MADHIIHIAHLLTAAAYYAIPVVIERFHRARPDLLPRIVARLFQAFILACAIEHTVQDLAAPTAGKATLAVIETLISVGTALLLWVGWRTTATTMPRLLHLPRLAHDELDRLHADTGAGRFWWDFSDAIVWDRRSCEIFGVEPPPEGHAVRTVPYREWSDHLPSQSDLEQAQHAALIARERDLPYQIMQRYERPGAPAFRVFSAGRAYDDATGKTWMRGYNILIHDDAIRDNISREMNHLARLAQYRERVEQWRERKGLTPTDETEADDG